MYALKQSADISFKVLEVLSKEQAKYSPDDDVYKAYQTQITQAITRMQASLYDLGDMHTDSKRRRVEEAEVTDHNSNRSTPVNQSWSGSPVGREPTNSDGTLFSPINNEFASRLAGGRGGAQSNLPTEPHPPTERSEEV